MLLRVFLIVAILAGIGVIVISQVQLRPHIQGIIDERTENAKQRDDQKKRANKAETDLKETKGKLSETETKLGDTEKQLVDANTKVADESKRANGLQEDLGKTKMLLKDSQQNIAAWEALGIPVEQVKTVIAKEKQLRVANDALEEEKKILSRKVVSLNTELEKWTKGDDREVVLPTGLRGKILVVDPKWNFVVLNIGEKDGVLQNGIMMVSRESRLLAKVRIMSVQSDRCIANILPGWRLGEVSEGDQVLY